MDRKNKTKALVPAIVLCCVLGLSFFAACAKKEVTKTEDLFALDTYVRISITGQEAEPAMKEATALLRELEDRYSVTIEGSETDRLNHSSEGSPVTLSEETYALLSKVVQYAEDTDGIFDPTVGPLMTLWGFGSEGEKKVPDEKEIGEALSHVDYKGIHLLSGNQAYVDPDTIVDLGGAAKGCIGDTLMRRIREHNVSRVILDLGGNICAWDKGGSLTIGVIDPLDPSSLAVKVKIPSSGDTSPMSVITSGAYERYLDVDGVRYGHIMDTKTGRPVQTDLLSATVITEDGAQGDILSTALFAMGTEKAKEYASGKGIACILVTEDGTIWVTKEWKERVTASDGRTIRDF